MIENNCKPRILIADDEAVVREMLHEFLMDNYECREVSSAEEVLKTLPGEDFQLIISDILMPGMSGLEMIPHAARIAPDTIIVMISGLNNIESGIKAMRAGAFDYITKPFDFDQISEVVKRALEFQKLRVAKRAAESEKFRLAAIVESSDDAIISKSLDGTVLTWNKGAERIFGYAPEEIIGQKISVIFPKELYKKEEQVIERIRRGECISTYETIRKTKDGTNIPVSLTISPIKNPDGKTVGISKITRDITSRIQVEQALRRSEERYRAFIKQSTEGIWRVEIKNPFSIHLQVVEQMNRIRQDGYIAECNDAMAVQYGFTHAEELINKRIDEFLAPSDSSNEQHLRNFVESEYRLADTETIEIDKKGQKKYFLSNLTGIVEDGKLVRIWGTQRDITLAKQTEQAFIEAEEQRRQSQKVEAIGRLAGGIAHDFNNFLAVIMLHVGMLNLQLPADSSLRYRIDEIKSVTENAAGMVRQLLAFSRKQPMNPQPVVLNHLVRGFIKVLRPLLGEDIEVKLTLNDDLGVCFVDPNQITQILMNLAVNARDAIQKGGEILIETSNLVLDKRSARHKAQPLGSYVQLTVTDNGVGMDAPTQERIFEPFFTTKEVGKGTGLGLSTVYGIVKQSNGFIWVESRTNEGTTFKIQFPRIDQAAECIKSENAALDIPGGNETILLVEDEEQIRRAAVEVLRALGYQVFEAGNGMQALQLAEIFNKPIDLLVTDVVMPKMNGKQLAEKVKVFHPETKVLFISGYTKDLINYQGNSEESVCFLEKPFSHHQIAVKVREALESSKTGKPPVKSAK